MQKKITWKLGTLLLILFIFFPFAEGVTGTYSQTMTWIILASRAHTISYGGTCTASLMYFNEIDANFDPDNDGNAAKVLPSGQTRLTGTTSIRDYNFVGVTNPSAGNAAYIGSTTLSVPTSASTISVEATTTEYTELSIYDSTSPRAEGNGSEYAAIKAVFKNTIDLAKLAALVFRVAYTSTVMDSQCANGAPDGTDSDSNVFLWDNNNGKYRRILTVAGDPQLSVGVPNNVDRNIVVDLNFLRFIGSDNNITLLIESGVPTSGTNISCIYPDTIQMRAIYYADNNAFCQSSTVAPLTIRNTGTTDINVDGNFANAFSGSDINLVLKVWQGTGSGCGTLGFGGWEKDCSITTTYTAPTATTCRNYNQFNYSVAGRLVTNLAVQDNNQLCLSGDLNTYLSGGARAKSFYTFDTNAT